MRVDMALRDPAGAPRPEHLDSDCGRDYRRPAFHSIGARIRSAALLLDGSALRPWYARVFADPRCWHTAAVRGTDYGGGVLADCCMATPANQIYGTGPARLIYGNLSLNAFLRQHP